MNITASEVSFSYETDHPVLSQVTVEAHPQSILAIVGPNGSGKSTLVRNLSGVLQPTAGVVYLDDEPIHTLPPREVAKVLASVEQQTYVGFSFTVREVVAMGRYPHQMRFARESTQDANAIDSALALTELEDLVDRPIHTLSGGEYQSTLIATALAQQPKVLLLDEPTAHLDINHQMHIMEIIRHQAAAGVTVLLTIHDLTLAAQHADTVAMLHQGGILALGAPEQVISEDNIKTAFHADVAVGKNPVTDSLYVTPLPYSTDRS